MTCLSRRTSSPCFFSIKLFYGPLPAAAAAVISRWACEGFWPAESMDGLNCLEARWPMVCAALAFLEAKKEAEVCCPTTPGD